MNACSKTDMWPWVTINCSCTVPSCCLLEHSLRSKFKTERVLRYTSRSTDAVRRLTVCSTTGRITWIWVLRHLIALHYSLDSTLLPSVFSLLSSLKPSNPVVTTCTTILTFNNSTFCPHSVFMYFVWIWEQTAIISLYSINWLVCITEKECVYCSVRTGYL